MKHWKFIAVGIMVAVGAVFVFKFGFITAGQVWWAAAVLLAWMQ